MKRRLFAASLALFMLSVPLAVPAGASPAGPALRNLFTSELTMFMKQNPELATFLGDYRYDGNWSLPGEAGFTQGKRGLEDFQRKLNAIKMNGATLSERNDMRLLQALIEGQRVGLAQAREGKDPGAAPLAVVGVFFTMILNKQGQDSSVWWDHVISRLEKAPAWLDAERPLVTHPGRLQGEVAAKQLAQAPGLFSGLLGGMAAELPADKRARFKKANDAMVASIVAWQKWIDGNDKSWPYNYAMGRVAYDHMLKSVQLLPYDADGIEAIGQKTLDDAIAAQKAVLAKAKAQGVDLSNPQQAAAHGGGPTPTTKDAQFAFFQSALDTLNTFVRDKHVVTIPAYMGSMKIVETPPFLQPVLPGPSMNAPPLMSNDRNGVYFVPPPNPEMAARAKGGAIFEDFDLDRVLMTSGHEGIPGHFLQLSIAKHNSNPIRRFSFDGVFSEGWAFYEERLLEQLGLYQDHLDGPYAVTQFERLRGARAIVDAKLATGDWAFDKAVAWFKENAGVDDATALGEVSRHALGPGQAYDYAVGRSQIDELLAKVKARKGDAFNLQAFHDDLLSHGTVPFSVVASEMLAEK